jgi:hypothetical protein
MKLKFSIIFLFLFLKVTLLAQDVRILTSDVSSITLEYKPTLKDTVIIKGPDRSFVKIDVAGTSIENSSKFGIPQQPIKIINIGVPSDQGNTIQVLSSEFSVFNGLYIPNPYLEKDSAGVNTLFKMNENYYSFKQDEILTFGEYGLVRNLPVQTIKLYPINFDASARAIKVYSKIIFKINYGSIKSAKTRIEENTLSSLVINWDTARNWGEKETRLSKISNSLLADGTWYRFETPEEGIYKVDRAFLQNLGIDVNTLDPKTLKIFSYGGYALPEDLKISNNQGFSEVAIQVIGEQDGKFDTGDYILFYGRPPEFWEYSSTQKKIVRVKHPFSKKNYFWLTSGGATGKRIVDQVSLSLVNPYKQETTFAYKSREIDSVNIGKSGRDYLGDVLDVSLKSRTFVNTLNNWVPGTQINYSARLVNATTSMVDLKIDESGTQVYNTQLYAIDPHYDFGNEDIADFKFKGNLTDERSILKFSIVPPTSSTKVYLDYFELYYSKYLRSSSDNFLFFSKDTTATIEYTVTNFSSSNIQVFNVTDFANVKLISNASVSGGQIRFQSSESVNKVNRYFALTSSVYKVPSNAAKVDNVNIRGNISGSQMVIISPKDFKTQAERYANYRSTESPNKMSSQIFYVDEIFNEFSGGLMDPTAIRDLLKFAYESWAVKPFYVLILGDGTFDYLNTVKDNKNFVPTYQSVASLNEISSYPSDDYYAKVAGIDNKIDLALGRLNVNSTKEADVVIDKIIAYEKSENKSDWRNTITLIADDGPAGIGSDDGSLHTGQSENLSNIILPKSLYQNKIYLVAYPTEYVGLGRRKPEVNKAIINSINDGTLLLNYIGHGSPELWAHENVFEKTTSMPQIKNDKYFFLTAATCDFGRYDDPSMQSSAEAMITLNNAGAIIAFTAARIVYSQYNATLNDSLYTNLFRTKDPNGMPTTVGRAYFLTKQYQVDKENDEKYHLFGDPAVRLNMPVLKVIVDSINGKSSDLAIQINALSTVKIKGSVRNSDGKINPINGEVTLSVFDSERSSFFKEMDYYVREQGGLIFKGRASVLNGTFETEFVVPKDISYENKKGKIVAYVSNSQIDGVGYTNNFTVGGTNQSAVNDGKGPEIEILFDNPDYESSYIVNSTFTLFAKLKDNVGLNTTGSGIGHKLEAILNDDETNTYDLTKNFIGDLNSGGKSGLAKYTFSNLETGEYKIKVKAWDVFNNFSSQEAIVKVVDSDLGLVVRDVVNYPNPFSSSTTFTFQHNYTSAINTKIKIYTIAGRLIKEIESINLLDRFIRLYWDGNDNDGNQLANGTYLYKLIVESVDGNFSTSVLGKLTVIR